MSGKPGKNEKHAATARRKELRLDAGAERVEQVAVPPLGLTVNWKNGRIASLHLRRAEGPRLDKDASESAQALHAALSRLAKGQCADFPDLPLDWDQLPPFTRQVLSALLGQVGHGATVTYGELARLSGNPGKARAVGQAMARNPWPLVYPCHRILAAGGRPGGFSAQGGLELKGWLLELEGWGARNRC